MNNIMNIISNMKQINNNPVINNLVNMMNNKDSSGIESLARNLCKSKGIDADLTYNNIKNKYGKEYHGT